MSVNLGLLNLPCLTARNTLSYFEGAPPLGLAYVAAAAREAGYQPFVLDALGEATSRYCVLPSAKGDLVVQGYTAAEIDERIPLDLDVLGIGNLFLHELRFLESLLPRLKARRPDLVVILGGENATGMWENVLERLPDVTGVILGEGEQAFVKLLQTLDAGGRLEDVPSLGYRADGTPRSNPAAPRIREIDDIPWPAWDLFPIEQYLAAGIRSGVNRGRSLPLLTSRGCPFRCAFCSAPHMWGTTYVSRCAAKLLDEVEFFIRKYDIDNFDFRDLTAALTKKWVKSFHAEVTARQARFTWQIPQGTRSENLDRETLELMYETGCRNFGYALESVSPEVITRMKKKVVPEKLMASVREALRLPMQIEVFFIVGYAGETTRDHLAYMRAILQLAFMGAQSISVMQFNAYPGSEDFFRLRAEKKIDFADDAYIYSSLFRTTGQGHGTYSSFSHQYLFWFELACLILFWGVQFLVRPWRLLRLGWNLIRAREETILEQFLVVKSRQWFRLRRQSPSAISVVGIATAIGEAAPTPWGM